MNKVFLLLAIGFVGCDATDGGYAPLKWAENAMLETVSMETSIRVTWPPLQEGRVSAYQLYVGEEVAAVVDGGLLTYQVDDLDPAREYSIAVRASDSEGHFSETALRARVWTIDETPPSWLSPELNAEILSPTRVQLNWSGAQDNSAVTHYLLYQGSALIQRFSADETSYVWSNLTPAGTYTLTLQAMDGAGLISSDGPSTQFVLPDDTAPEWTADAALSVTAQTETTISVVWDEAIDDGQLAGYRVFVDGALQEELLPEVRAATLDHLSPGRTYGLTVLAFDSSGNQSTELEVQASTGDEMAPEWPENTALEVLSVLDDAIELRWPLADDLGGVETYVVLQDLVEQARLGSDVQTWRAEDLAPDTSYVFEVYALDRSANRSRRPLALEVRTTDSLVPSWPAGAEIRVVQQGAGRVELNWPAAADNVGVVAYEVALDGLNVAEVDGTRTFLVAGDLIQGRRYEATVVARDRVGGVSASIGAAFTIADERSPEWAPDAQLGIAALSETDMALSWPPATDNVGVTHYEIRIDGQLITLVDSTTEQYTVSDLEPWTEYRVRVSALDQASNRSEPALGGNGRTLDTTPPSHGPEAALIGESIEPRSCVLAWHPALDNVGVVTYLIRQNGELVYEGGHQEMRTVLDGLQPGQRYLFELFAVDAAGLQSAPVSLELVTQDAGPPTWPADARIRVEERRGQQLTLGWTPAQDDIGISEYLVFHQNALVRRVPGDEYRVEIDGLSLEGEHTFRLEAEDGQGARSVGGPQLVLSLADAAPPVWPVDSEVSVIAVGADYVDLSWPAAMDDVGVSAYRLRLGEQDSMVIAGDQTQVRLTGLLPLTAYDATLTAEDVVGQESARLHLQFQTTDYAAPIWPEAASVEVETVRPDAVSIRWTQALGVVSHYVIYVDDEAFAEIDAGGQSVRIAPLLPETMYAITVMAVGPTGRMTAQALSLPVTTLADVPPAWPEDSELVVSEQTDTALTVSWPPLPAGQEIAEYHVELNGELIASVSAERTSYRIRDLNIGQAYRIAIQATNARGLRSVSGPDVMVVLRDRTPPTWPVGSVVTTEDVSVTKARVSWSIAHDNVGVETYRIYGNDVQLLETPADTRHARLASLEPGQRYVLRIEAVDAEGVESIGGPVTAIVTRDRVGVPDDDTVRLALAEHCQECHQPWFADLDGFRGIFMALESARVRRPLLVPGEPQQSLLIEFLEGTAPDAFVYRQMPPDDDFAASSASFDELSDQGLTQVTTLQIRDWIELLEVAP